MHAGGRPPSVSESLLLVRVGFRRGSGQCPEKLKVRGLVFCLAASTLQDKILEVDRYCQKFMGNFA